MELDVQDGALVEVVKTTRKVELQELTDKVNAAEAALAEVNARREASAVAHAALETEVAAAQSEVDGSKSLVTRATELVGATPTPELDSGTVEPSSDPAAEVAQPVDVPAEF